MSSDVVIQVDRLSKQYRLGEVSTGSLGHDLNRWWHRLRGKEDPYLNVTHANVRESKSEGLHEYVWALNDVAFEVRQGEVMGIIGRNGAGKRTLLKILSRITSPTTGEVRIKGRIASLLEVGTGFHQDLTGRENIFMNGAVLGMTKQEIRNKLDEIVAFSGCERYIDTPVKRYSSGMVVRLGFAVAAHLEPEILIVDEVLAVGDFSFQAKCIGKMSEVARAGRTVLFVSHNLAAVQNLCQTAILLNQGQIAHQKDQVEKVLMTYENAGRSASGYTAIHPRQHAVRSPLQITGIEMLGLNDRSATDFKYGEAIRLRLQIDCREILRDASAGIALRASGMVLTTFLSGTYDLAAGQLWLECLIPGGTLLPGLYEFDVGASRAKGSVGLDYVRSVASFSVSDVGVDREWMHDRRLQGVASLPSQWSVHPVY